MTSSKSLFNFGIYKNTLKRFKWGSFLYFIILFFSLPFILLVQDKEYLVRSYSRVLETTPLLLQSGFMVIPILLAMIVPTIVATLCFNNVHSAKQSNFVHSLPVTRLENYISNVLAGLTLIVLPVLLNAGILLIMSLTGYQEIIASSSVIYWFFINIAISFIMLSVSVFSAFLTGHTAAHIAINILIHTAPLIIALGIYLVSQIFLFGFSESDNFIANEIVNNTPMVWLYARSLSFINKGNMFLTPQMWIFIAMAIAFYVLAFVLYKNRKIESCGDVAAFKSFRPILKYTATVFAAILIFGMLASSNLGAVAIFTIAAVVTAVVYFASEMLIRKTVKVFKSYKGYIGFALLMAIFISIFAYTDIFGYERRIPERADIESATIYNRVGENIPFVADDKLIEDVRTLHAELTSDIPVVDNDLDRYSLLRVRYNLKNGKVLERAYRVTEEVHKRAISKMYENAEYKNIVYSFDMLNIDKVKNMELRLGTSTFTHHISVNNDAKAILEAVKKDLAVLSYDEIEGQQFGINISFSISQTAEENEDSKVFVTAESDDGLYYSNRMYHINMQINSNFKNTFKVLTQQGYYAEF
ncbi:MAG: sulfite exporter TauE/SafE family protein, partial [Clostridia bacterium]|nr:sulfite exporter TauE/SafE family protein [Clostridia bacterium]